MGIFIQKLKEMISYKVSYFAYIDLFQNYNDLLTKSLSTLNLRRLIALLLIGNHTLNLHKNKYFDLQIVKGLFHNLWSIIEIKGELQRIKCL